MLESKLIYNNMEDIDQLIEQLEQTTPTNSCNSSRVQTAIDKRKNQISELRRLRDAAKKQALEEEILSQIEADNDQADKVIASIKKLVKVAPKRSVSESCSRSSESSYGYSSESNYGYSSESNYNHPSNHYVSYNSESRNGGESR